MQRMIVLTVFYQLLARCSVEGEYQHRTFAGAFGSDKEMGECDLLKGCVFYNDKMNIEGDLGMQYKEYYCKGNYNECARYRVARTIGREYVSHTLYPNMEKRAQQLIFSGK